MLNNGVYICLEGLKGAGKTTLFNDLVARLEENQVEFSTVSPTRSAGEDYFIERLFKRYPSLKTKRLPRVLLYAKRSNHAAIQSDWNKKLILGERSIATSYATKWSASRIRTWFNFGIINLMENKIKAPDYIIYLDVPHGILRGRIESRDKERDLDDTPTRLVQMEQAYVEMMGNCEIKRLSNVKWIKVTGVGDRKEIADKVLQLVLELSNTTSGDKNII